MAEEKMPHPGHGKHLCYLQDKNFHQDNRDEYKTLVSDAQFLCTGCGRTANKAESLCAPEKL